MMRFSSIGRMLRPKAALARTPKAKHIGFGQFLSRQGKALFSALMLAATPLVLTPTVAQAQTFDASKLTPQQRLQGQFMLDIQADFYDSVKTDLQKGADINGLLPDGQLPILEAIANKSNRVFQVLWANPKLNINAVNHLGENLMMYLAIEKKSQYDKIEDLIKRGATINKLGWTPLSYAIYANHPDIVLLLLKHGAFPNQIDPNGHTPLTLALSQEVNLSSFSRMALVKALLEGGVNPVITDGLGKQAIDYTDPDSDLHEFLKNATKEYLIKHGYLYPDGSDNDGP